MQSYLLPLNLKKRSNKACIIKIELRAAKEAYGTCSKQYDVIRRGLNEVDGRNEMQDKKEIAEAGLTQGEHFVLLAVIHLCRIFWPNAIGGGYGLIPSRYAHIMNAYTICMTFLWAAKNAYGTGSKKYGETEQALNAIVNSYKTRADDQEA